MSKSAYRDAILIALTAIAIDTFVALYIGTNRPSYLCDYRLSLNPDAEHYVLLGRNYWRYGVYSRMSHDPYELDVMRTPIYPLVVGGLDLIHGVWVVFAFQGACR